MEKPFKVELHSVPMSVVVGFFTIFLFVFQFNLYETYWGKFLNAYSEQVSQEASAIQDGKNSNTKENNKKAIELELQDLKKSFKNTMDYMKQYLLIAILASIIIGEILSTTGIIIINALFEKPFHGGIKIRETFVHMDGYESLNVCKDKNTSWIKVKELLYTLNLNSGHLGTLSMVYLALAKGFAGVFVSFVLLNPLAASIYTISLHKEKENVGVFDIAISNFLPILLAMLFLVAILKELECLQSFFNRIRLASPKIFFVFYLFLFLYALISSLAISVLPISYDLSASVLLFHVISGIIALIFSIHNFQLANQMLYIIYEKISKEKA